MIGIFVLLVSSGVSGTVTGWLIRSVLAANSTPHEPTIAQDQVSPVRPAQNMMPFTAQVSGQQVHLLQQQQAERSAKAAADAEQQRLTYSVPKQFQGVTLQSAQLKIARDAIALTFDDGPWDTTTDQILDILAQEGVKATFFWVGQAVQNQPEVARRVVNAGHAIGNHTMHHRYDSMSAADAADEIETAAQVFQEVAGIRTKLFRPPGGYLNNGLADYAMNQGDTVVTWSVASSDTDSTRDAQTYVHNVLSTIKPGGIVLMHDGGGDRSKTVEALPVIIRSLKAQGYRFVTVPELLRLESDGW